MKLYDHLCRGIAGGYEREHKSAGDCRYVGFNLYSLNVVQLDE